ncbi:GPI ethanolamine phosphate transferase 1-like [Thrips palmi]|uniref:GPI ethanolamine phosphate transferase 1 n=1 Tax=Thrips palmi TaxID=161013 RepID=A0A6P9A575_THRPL|nr:GPI ethanolamine phosphate transferase 1-like [Thrips palmi]
MRTIGVLCGGFLLHLVFLASIFDIYFKTPIVSGILSKPNPVPGPAKRLVFIVADGLRADSFYSNDKSKSTPFLRNKLENHASWGVSHTRVPTESRPGIVALAAGIYEDPSAVFKGWKENPVEFDSLFNQSRLTWAWGSPDIVHMFKQGNVKTMSYSPDDEDFSGKEASWKLDKWVFEHVKLLFDDAIGNPELNDKLHSDKLVFFLHLLGLDTAGHTVKPVSKTYQTNLKYVDRGIQLIEQLFEEFFNDGKTSYVFTADHGMTNWGSHGAGSKEETEVPLLAWGAGIKGPSRAEPWDPVSPDNWQLSDLKRHDVDQADIVVLLASLIGCSIPVNSVGRLPLPFLDLPVRDLAKLSFLNAKQLLAQANRKREILQRGSLSWLYRPYWKLTSEEAQIREKLINQFINSQKYDKAIQLSEDLSDLSIHALRYYHNYYQGLLLTVVSLSFLGWIVWLLCQLNIPYRAGQTILLLGMGRHGRLINKVFLALTCLAFILIQVQGLEWQFNVYCLLPLLLWWSVFSTIDLWSYNFISTGRLWNCLIFSAILLLFIEIMVAAFFQRWVLSVGVLFLSLWPILGTEKTALISPSLMFSWLFSCAILAIFPLLPVIGSESNVRLVVFSGFVWVGSLTFTMSVLQRNISMYQTVTLLLPLLFALWIVQSVTTSLAAKAGLPFVYQCASWLYLVFSWVEASTGEKAVPKRLLRLHLSIVPLYMLLCVRHEALFLLALCFHLLCWFLIEAQLNGISFYQLMRVEFPHITEEQSAKRKLSFEDFRRAALFVFYIFLSFFGTGNIASLNSFEVVWVRCFLSVFSPFTMMILILLKTFIPFVLVTCVFRAINITIKAPTKSMFMAVLIISDLMGLHFLYLVTNEGSWLDIGTSISHYVIVQVTVLALVLLYGIASVITGAHVPNINFKVRGRICRLWGDGVSHHEDIVVKLF